MATYSDIIKFEEEAGEGVIRLIKSGGFYRAYNHSAWLFQCCIAEHKVIRRYVKSLERNIYYIGFPDKNLFANIGERESEKTRAASGPAPRIQGRAEEQARQGLSDKV